MTTATTRPAAGNLAASLRAGATSPLVRALRALARAFDRDTEAVQDATDAVLEAQSRYADSVRQAQSAVEIGAAEIIDDAADLAAVLQRDALAGASESAPESATVDHQGARRGAVGLALDALTADVPGMTTGQMAAAPPEEPDGYEPVGAPDTTYEPDDPPIYDVPDEGEEEESDVELGGEGRHPAEPVPPGDGGEVTELSEGEQWATGRFDKQAEQRAVERVVEALARPGAAERLAARLESDDVVDAPATPLLGVPAVAGENGRGAKAAKKRARKKTG